MSRYGLGRLIPDASGLPTATFLVNIVGAFALGALIQFLADAVPSPTPRHTLRLVWGTGFLGGFTTYSGLAASATSIVRDGRAIVGVVYAVATVLSGVVTAYLGVLTGGHLGRRVRAHDGTRRL